MNNYSNIKISRSSFSEIPPSYRKKVTESLNFIMKIFSMFIKPLLSDYVLGKYSISFGNNTFLLQKDIFKNSLLTQHEVLTFNNH